MNGQFEEDKFLDDLEEQVTKKVKTADKEKKSKVNYQFTYVNTRAKVCVNTMVSTEGEKKIPTYVIFDGNTGVHRFAQEFKTPEGILITVPPATEGLYRDLYEEIVFPDTIVEDTIPTEVIDEAITKFLSTWNSHPDDFYIIARNFIKYTWIFERFYFRPCLTVFGDWGTGKTEWGSFITRLCQNGLVMEDVSRSEERRVGKECRSRWSPYH